MTPVLRWGKHVCACGFVWYSANMDGSAPSQSGPPCSRRLDHPDKDKYTKYCDGKMKLEAEVPAPERARRSSETESNKSRARRRT